jgi:hypothetical protein
MKLFLAVFYGLLCGCGMNNKNFYYMKITILICLLLLSLFACDRETTYNYYIKNQCDTSITVHFETHHRLYLNNDNSELATSPIDVEADMEKYIGTTHGLGKVFNDFVELNFSTIKIYKGNKESNINYINKNIWQFAPLSKTFANVYLIVNPGNFEEEKE